MSRRSSSKQASALLADVSGPLSNYLDLSNAAVLTSSSKSLSQYAPSKQSKRASTSARRSVSMRGAHRIRQDLFMPLLDLLPNVYDMFRLAGIRKDDPKYRHALLMYCANDLNSNYLSRSTNVSEEQRRSLIDEFRFQEQHDQLKHIILKKAVDELQGQSNPDKLDIELHPQPVTVLHEKNSPTAYRTFLLHKPYYRITLTNNTSGGQVKYSFSPREDGWTLPYIQRMRPHLLNIIAVLSEHILDGIRTRRIK